MHHLAFLLSALVAASVGTQRVADTFPATETGFEQVAGETLNIATGCAEPKNRPIIAIPPVPSASQRPENCLPQAGPRKHEE